MRFYCIQLTDKTLLLLDEIVPLHVDRDIEDRDRKTAQVCFVRGGDQREKEVGREKGGERVPVPER